jgi:O-antigen/teichoic acid export membrane protein
MLPKSEFSKNVLTVMTGTGMAQTITILFSPILTRLFTPEEFGIFYLFSALADILVIFATGRYELAILIPKDEKDAANTFWTAGFLSTVFSVLLFIFIYAFNIKIGTWLREPKISTWLYFLPPFILIRGWMVSFHYWYNRHKRFKIITGSKIAESSTNVGSRIGLGVLNLGTGGLIIGTLLGRLTTLLTYVYFFLKNNKEDFPKPDKAAIKLQLQRFKSFPKNMVPAGFFNASSTQLPNILINFFYTATVVGHYGFMNRIVRTPLSVIGRSFEEVFKQKASEELQQIGHCKNIFYKTLKRLFAIAIIPFIIFYFASPVLFELVFGEKWLVAGQYAQIFTIPLFLNFIASSLSSIFYLKEKTQIYSRLSFLQLSLVIFAFLLSQHYDLESKLLIYLLAIAYTISYSLMIFILVKIVED